MEKDQFIAGILNGDAKIVAKIWRDCFPSVYKWAIENGASKEDAEDVFQDTMICVYDKAQRPGFKLTSKFSTYFLAISRNLLGNLFQKKYSSHITLPDDAKYILDEPVDYDEMERRKLFDRAKALQGEDCRKVMELYFQKKTMAEIAAVMGFKSEDYAKLRKFQCKQRLEELVRQQPGFEELFNRKKS